MEKSQKTTLLLFSLLGLAYFIACWIPNASTLGSQDAAVFLDRDEYVTYPVVERMLALQGSLSNIWGRLIIYGDYHYGYPFYFFSMLVLLPARLLQGAAFFDHTAFNILLLRQFINVLPMLLAAGLLAYVHTRFQSWWKALLIFCLLISIPAVVRSNLHWWHPDALMLLFIALTFFFLQKDRLRLGSHFYLAAAACGMASAIKLMGFFFFLAIPLYLLMARRAGAFTWKTVARAALLFVLVMGLVILFSNPFLFYAGPRQEMLATQIFKSQELSEGYPHEESLYYSKGPQFWRWTLLASYGRPWVMVALAAALLLGMFLSREKVMYALLAAWCLPLAVYLLWFVAPKPDHYLLPLLLPLFSGALNPLQPLQQLRSATKKWHRALAVFAMLALGLFLLYQFHYQLARSLEKYLSYFQAF
jgi:hypothetical protein